MFTIDTLVFAIGFLCIALSGWLYPKYEKNNNKKATVVRFVFLFIYVGLFVFADTGEWKILVVTFGGPLSFVSGATVSIWWNNYTEEFYTDRDERRRGMWL